MGTVIRKAEASDLAAVAAIYDEILTDEEQNGVSTGWVRGVYPTAKTAEDALAKNELYVLVKDGEVLASAKINAEQMPAYAFVTWEHPAPPEQVLVLHTLTVARKARRQGLAHTFLAFYEKLARELGCPELRIDTNELNLTARRLYRTLGYTERGVVPGTFNGIEGVGLVCLEKRLGD